jgi:hypothetical protein
MLLKETGKSVACVQQLDIKGPIANCGSTDAMIDFVFHVCDLRGYTTIKACCIGTNCCQREDALDSST